MRELFEVWRRSPFAVSILFAIIAAMFGLLVIILEERGPGEEECGRLLDKARVSGLVGDYAYAEALCGDIY